MVWYHFNSIFSFFRCKRHPYRLLQDNTITKNSINKNKCMNILPSTLINNIIINISITINKSTYFYYDNYKLHNDFDTRRLERRKQIQLSSSIHIIISIIRYAIMHHVLHHFLINWMILGFDLLEILFMSFLFSLLLDLFCLLLL